VGAVSFEVIAAEVGDAPVSSETIASLVKAQMALTNPRNLSPAPCPAMGPMNPVARSAMHHRLPASTSSTGARIVTVGKSTST
jgi:hypothetical protein